MLQVHRFVAAERWHTDRWGVNGSGAKEAQTNGELHLIARGDYGGLTSPLPLLPMQDGSICASHVNLCQKYRHYA
jgi:hypothetical protein